VPQNREAEEGVIGSVLINGEFLPEVLDAISPVHFYCEDLRRAFACIVDIHKRQEPIELVTLTTEMSREEWFVGKGGVSWLTELMRNVPDASNVMWYARLVHEAWRKRKAFGVVLDLAAQDPERFDSADEYIAHIQEATTTGLPMADDPPMTWPDALDEAERRVRAAVEAGGSPGLKTGIRDVDTALGGLFAKYYVLAGWSGMGKTSKLLQLLRNVAKDYGPVALFPLESSAVAIAMKLLGSESGVSVDVMMRGRTKLVQLDDIARAKTELAKHQIYVEDRAGMTCSQIASRARVLKARHGIVAMGVDYIQLVEADGRGQSDKQRVSATSRGLMHLKNELDIPVLAISQLRKLQQGVVRRPMLSDLKESGDIENDADVVAFVYREHHHNQKAPEWLTWLLVDKNRDGPERGVPLGWDGARTRYYDLDPETKRKVWRESGGAPEQDDEPPEPLEPRAPQQLGWSEDDKVPF
jgi:replicative DNA helicase